MRNCIGVNFIDEKLVLTKYYLNKIKNSTMLLENCVLCSIKLGKEK